MRSVLALAGVIGSLVLTPVAAVAAPHIILSCPSEARGTVTHTGDAGWIATNQSSRVTGVRFETIGGQSSLVCVYLMFGSEYWIYRRPQADYPRCRPADGGAGFYCQPPA
ncbi:MAG: hypothetical protein HY834_11560 [Devosia nanyangense]|uniref:Secreted protein n=1 Tax=Devosia nanyangense TaxID=1228055 RepID=A0A933L1S0_9HYPH|nr:hypothetical protein [Devosia nanyangense]